MYISFSLVRSFVGQCTRLHRRTTQSCTAVKGNDGKSQRRARSCCRTSVVAVGLSQSYCSCNHGFRDTKVIHLDLRASARCRYYVEFCPYVLLLLHVSTGKCIIKGLVIFSRPIATWSDTVMTLKYNEQLRSSAGSDVISYT